MSELPKNMKELLRHFPRKIPKNICKEIDIKGKEEYLFCYDREDKQKAICSSCGRKVIIPEYNVHNLDCKCPKCGKVLQVKHIWRGLGNLKQSVLSYHYLKSRIDDDVVVCMVVYTHYSNTGAEPWKNKPFRSVDARYVFVPGKGAIYAADKYKMQSCAITQDNERYRWQIKPYIRPMVRLREG